MADQKAEKRGKIRANVISDSLRLKRAMYGFFPSPFLSGQWSIYSGTAVVCLTARVKVGFGLRDRQYRCDRTRPMREREPSLAWPIGTGLIPAIDGRGWFTTVYRGGWPRGSS